MCEISISELVTISPEDATTLFKRLVQKLLEHANNNPGQPHWLSCTEKMIPLLAAQPDDLVGSVSHLKDVWMNGGYIGDLAVIFGSFRYVAPARRGEVREKLKALYEEMKAVNPRLVNVDWSD